MTRLSLALGISALCLLPQTSHGAEPKPWTLLFDNADLKGWDTYLGPAYDPAKKEFAGEPVGLNQDPEHVFSVVEIDGEKAIRISGVHFGGLSTVKEYANYELELEMKWGQGQYAPRATGKRDSGLLYHAVEPHGADGRFWMRSFEFQVQEGDYGDYWGCGGAIVDVPAVKNAAGDFAFSPGAPLLTFSKSSPNGRHVVKGPATLPEKRAGEWNQLTLYALGGTSVQVFNSVVMMVLQNPRQIVDDKEVPLRRGKIQLQSEGAEVYYRHIRLRPISKLPKGLLPSGKQLAPAPGSAAPASAPSR